MAALIGVGGLACRRSGLVDESGRRIEDEVLAHIWPTHHENIHFYGTHTVDIAAELASLDANGYRPLRTPRVPEPQ